MVSKTDPLGDEFVYSYDEENHLVRSIKNGTEVEDFVYDANGMRVRRTVGGAVTDYFYDGVNLLYEATGGTGKNHVWANGTLLCSVQNGSYTYYHTDHLGTSKLQTDDQGKVVSIDVTVGDQVEENDTLAVFEAMKIEMPLAATAAGKVADIRVSADEMVEAEQVFCVIED